ncbi:Peptidase S8 and S53, subtilisin, kexin, sedolisin [Trichormus variabilis ATCC 29413]|uniref:Peptidase S8 and S53, subtilisin, kexin, sedolisin n=2 Tax=Anabaena variabilis TaxID=264691 RepID=Q3MB76_TRIV2|nr:MULTISPECIES: S8 family serine peptidase [Nostocaceae]ABA21760.1 Peptidase S8 and S53, subtilisin, kexin, sedolisin [Trichormus variabilis ATCC 29413]MBC1215420.1 S8 family serine peptidase [Trichormus variabilis ARAD]MBC1255505.1 S8 family serine peptidase [Trichormus variabilis V5]MBC1267605.1 S8 family serine peptidase [Trichormus variabilis FSR]MBC1304035.1 S8 family serine peptidase [Trichormus variabilis N2B]
MNDTYGNQRNNPSDFSTTGASKLGLVLQRGGEELILEKALDRFTIRFVTDFPVQQLSQVSWGIWHSSITQAQLELYQVAPNQIEEAIAQARADQNVTFASHAYTIKDNPGTFVYLSDQITIQFAPKLDAVKITLIASQFNLVEDKPIPGLPNAFVFLVSKQATENPVKIANQLQSIPEVLAAEPNVLIQAETHYKPSDNLYPQQWYLNHNGGNELATSSHIAVEQAWDITRGVRSVVVAVVDDSFDLNHPDFQGSGKIVAPRDLRENDFLPLPGGKEKSHGTACAGIALAEENGAGIVGVAPGCALMPIRTTGFLDDESIEQIFNWAIEKGASVISCSWGASAVYFPLSLRQKAAVTRAATRGRNGKGCVVLFAAGNANRPVSGAIYEQDWPDNVLQGVTDWLNGFGVHPDVMTIAASTSMSKKAAYSNWGLNISLCAPSNNASPGMSFPEKGFLYTQPSIKTNLSGLGMLTADIVGAAGYDPGNFTSNFGGTSSATPVVAGVAALVLSVNPDLTAQQVKRILETTADKIVDPDPDPQLGLSEGKYDKNGYSQWFGYGKVNAARAVQVALQQRTTLSDASKQVKISNSNRLEIPDNNIQGIKSTISVADGSSVKDIQVAVNLTHDFLGDIEIYLIAPNNQQVLLQNRTLGNRTDLQITYGVRSHPTLKQLLSQSATGNWQLWIIDYSPQDIGRLNSWELTLGI